MARTVLTERLIANLKPAAPGKRYIRQDAVVPGVEVRVTDRGHKTFLLGARYPGSPHFTRRQLGEVGVISLANAREKARHWLESIKGGTDPRVEIERQRAAEREAEANVFAAVAEAFIARHLRGKRRADRAAREIRTELVSQWGRRPIAEITRADAVRLIEAIVDRPAPAYAHNIFAHARGMFNWCINRGIYGLESSPFDRLRPEALIGPRRVRDRVLTDDEIRKAWLATAALGYPWGQAVRLLMLSGVRLREAADAQWQEFDLANRLWTIPPERFKVKAAHTVPLTDDMVELIQELPRWHGSDLLFTCTGKPLVNFAKPKERLDRLMGGDVPPWVVHDVRRTVRTRLSQLRVPESVAELVIGHSKRGLARVYDQHRFIDEMREALEAWNARLRSIIYPQEKVVPLRRDGAA
jgi:integrase